MALDKKKVLATWTDHMGVERDNFQWQIIHKVKYLVWWLQRLILGQLPV